MKRIEDVIIKPVISEASMDMLSQEEGEGEEVRLPRSLCGNQARDRSRR